MLDKFLVFENSISNLENISSWKYIRLRFYNKFYHPVAYEERHNQKSFFKKLIDSDFFLNIRKTKFNRLVIVHPRIHSCEYDYYCKYSDNYIDDNTLVLVYNKKLKKSYQNTISFGFLKFIVFILSVFTSLKSLREINLLNKYVYSEYNIKNKVRFLMLELLRISRSYSFEILYQYLLIFFKVKEVYGVVAYGDDVYPCLIASKKLKIKFTEIQHGVIDFDHIGYSYCSSQIKQGYFPKILHLWSQYWMNKIRIKNHVQFETTKPRYCIKPLVKKNKNRVLIIGQAHVRDRLTTLAKNLKDNHSNLEIIYRPHPSEIMKPITDFVQIDLDDLELSLSKSTFVIGVDSTVLIEAVIFNLNVIQFVVNNSYDFSGYESINTFYNEKDIINYFKSYL